MNQSTQKIQRKIDSEKNRRFIDIGIFEQYEKEHWIRRRRHSELPLFIWNYTEHTQFKKKWDTVTLMCRGLITDSEGLIVGRSFDKFHNYEDQHPDQFIKESSNFRVFNKADGSLGILFWYDDYNTQRIQSTQSNSKWIFASRGSFDSPQSIKGRSMIPEALLNELDKEYSYVFEIIYPENKIVVNYGAKEALVFLAAFKTDGSEHTDLFIDTMKKYIGLGLEIVEEYTHMYSSPLVFEQLKNENLPNKEGYVVLINDHPTGVPVRIKLKFENYKELHKNKYDITVKSVFEMMSNDVPVESITEMVPDEMHKWLQKVTTEIKTSHDHYKDTLTKLYDSIPKDTKKEFAMVVNKDVDEIYRSSLFKMISNRPVNYYSLIDIHEIEKKLVNFQFTA
jgi:RNA ligase